MAKTCPRLGHKAGSLCFILLLSRPSFASSFYIASVIKRVKPFSFGGGGLAILLSTLLSLKHFGLLLP
jgi:hypothetical protein